MGTIWTPPHIPDMVFGIYTKMVKVFSIPDLVPSKTALAITSAAIENAMNKIMTNELLRETMFFNANFSVNIRNIL